MPHAGKVQIITSQKDTVDALLYNFEIGKHQLKPEHEEWLDKVVAAYLKIGGSLFAVGMTSRSGTESYNLKLSQERVASVIRFLRKVCPNNFRVAFYSGVGETAAMKAGSRDGSEEERWRGILLSVWSHKQPPPAPIPVSKVIPQPVAPPLVSRRVYAEFLAEFNLSADPGDGVSTATLNQIANDQMFRATGGRDVRDEKRMMPPTYVLRQVFAYPDTTGSTQLGVSAVDMITCKVTYEWGVRRKNYCILINRMMRRAAFADLPPQIFVMDQALTDLWVSDPFKALRDESFNDIHSREVNWGLYHTGQL